MEINYSLVYYYSWLCVCFKKTNNKALIKISITTLFIRGLFLS